MRITVIILALSAGLVATVSAQDQLAKGEAVYAAQKCAMCHSIGEKGNKKGPLDGVGTKLSAADISLWMTDAKAMTAKTSSTRKPEMKSYALPKDELDALVAYMVSLKKK
jgi:mono/diheme cytochrome c family protein